MVRNFCNKSVCSNINTSPLWLGLAAWSVVTTSATLVAAQGTATQSFPDATTTQPNASEPAVSPSPAPPAPASTPPAAAAPGLTQPAPKDDVSSTPLATGANIGQPDAATPKAEPITTATPAETDEVAPVEVVPSRAERPFALTGSLGWNSLAGFAIGGTFSFDPHVSADVAFGVAAIGLKTGARVRYNLFESNWTPSFGMGVQYGPGSGGRAVVVQGSGSNGDAELILESSAFLQGMAAMSYQGKGGFTALFGAGYSVLLDKDNVQLVSGSEETADITRTVTGSGIVIEIALGYAF